MTSDAAPFERQIYVGVARHPSEGVKPVGLLKVVRRGVMESGEFAYGRRYLQEPGAQPLNPDHLPLRDAVFVLPERRLRDGGAMPLTLRDALPDAWGRKVLEVQHGRALPDIDVLLLTNDDRVGAMVFSETLPIQTDVPPAALLSLEDLAEASRRIEAGMEITPRMQQLLRGGASLGGVRPKATFVHEGRRYIAKFASRGDEHDMEVVEAATLGMAVACGITVPPFHLRPLAHGHALLVERFDRTGPISNEQRFHYLSCSALLDVPYESSSGSYVELAQALRRMSARPEQDVTELFHRMVFNLAVGNSDDHVKNHGVLHQGFGFWRLAPAFDLVAQLNSHAGYQELAILPGQHTSSLALAREAAPHFGLSAARADEIIQAIADTVMRNAYSAIKTAGGNDALRRRFKAFIEAQRERIELL
ncbi:HipA domain-containing protein [Polaromonas sp. P1(28)-13]|nr:HipA domain-containing protein [Polaromonas sp. P1(28)-13]